MRTNRTLSLARLCLLTALLLSFALPMAAQTSTDETAKMVSLMQANNYSFTTTRSPTVWVIHFTGTHLKDIKVVLAIDVANNQMVIFVTVVEKRRMPVTTDFLHQLLKFNHEFDRVKVGLDADDDLSVRIDAPLRIADAAELNNIVTQIKNASDEIYGKIEPSLLP
jgi:transposase-like protein